MPGLIRPPYGAPTGPLLDDVGIITAFSRGARTGHSPSFHVEEDVLLVDRLQPIAIRIGTDCLLIRTDLDSHVIEAAVSDIGLSLTFEDPPLATVVSLQTLALPAASWNLWTADAGNALQELERAVTDGVGSTKGEPF